MALAVLALVLVAGLALRPHPYRVGGHAYPIPSAQDRILVEVLNGTTRQGLARVGTRLLRREGLDVVFFGNADQPTESTRVLLRRGERRAAERVGSILGTGKVLSQPDTLLRLDVTVILGEDFRPPPELHP